MKIMKLSHSVKISVIVILLIAAQAKYAQCQQAQPGVILTGPETQVVAPGETVYFHCHARGESVEWYINGRYPYPPSDYEQRGFNFSYIEIPRPSHELKEHNNTITVEARPSNNNTLVSCAAMGQIHDQIDYHEGHLIIAGTPLAPSVDLNVELVDNGTFSFTLTWTTPFSWREFPITGYTVVLSNYSSGEAFNTTLTYGESNVSDIYMLQFNSTDNECYRIDIYVSANNSLGEGEPTVIRSGQPLIIDDIGEIETEVSFLSNGTPHFWMSFEAPRICARYQEATYNISIFSKEFDSFNTLYHIGPIDYLMEGENDEGLITMEVRDGFTFGGSYRVSVTFEGFQIVRSKSKDFDAVFVHESCQAIASNVSDCDGTASTNDVADDFNYCQVDRTTIIVAVVLTSLIVLLLGIIAILGYRLKRQSVKGDEVDGPCVGAQRNSTRREASNPIYEGAAIYETTPGDASTNLISATTTSGTRDSVSHRYVEQPPSLPPPRGQGTAEPVDEIDAIKSSLKQATLPKPHESQAGDVYVVMGPNSTKDS